MTTTALPDFALTVAYQRMCDLRRTARRYDTPARPVLARTRGTARTALRWLWEGQLALVPPVVDPGPPCASG